LATGPQNVRPRRIKHCFSCLTRGAIEIHSSSAIVPDSGLKKRPRPVVAKYGRKVVLLEDIDLLLDAMPEIPQLLRLGLFRTPQKLSLGSAQHLVVA